MGPSIGRSYSRPTVRPSQSSSRQQPSDLPNGACCFRDINLGHHAPTCACRRFWLSRSGQKEGLLQDGMRNDDSIPNEGAWCFCGHHACFHELDPAPRSPELNKAPDVNDRLRGTYSAQFMAPELLRTRQGSPSSTRSIRPSFGPGRDPQIARQEMSGSPAIYQESRSKYFAAQSTRLGLGLSLAGPHAPGNRTSLFGHEPQPQIDLPSTECDTDVASVSNAGEVSRERLMGMQPRVSIPQDRQVDEQMQSATEVNTPSNRGTPIFAEVENAMKSIKTGLDDLNSGIAQTPQQSGKDQRFTGGRPVQQYSDVSQDEIKRLEAAQSLGPSSVPHLIQQIASLRHLLSPSNLGNTFQIIHNRLDTIENISFAQGSVGDLSERIELFDGRLIDVENKVEEIEKALRYKVSRPSSFNEERVDMDHLESDQMTSNFVQRLGMLESRLHAINQARQEPSDPVDAIEVVLLPWGRLLSGIWKVSNGPVSRPNPAVMQSTATAGSATTEETVLTPNLFSLRRGDRQAYERLKSRGFVRKIIPESDSASSIHQAIELAFGDCLDALSVTLPQTLESSSVRMPRNSLALKTRFVPLKAVDSDLKFLAATELSDPGSWNGSFLSSCTTLKDRKRTARPRLFITSPSAYFQHPSDAGWTWQKLRELPRYHPDSPFSSFESGIGKNGVEEGDAREPCWAFNVEFDICSSTASSFATGGGIAGDLQKGSFGSKASAQQVSPQPTEKASSADEFEGVSDADASLPFDFGNEDLHMVGQSAVSPVMRPNAGENQFARADKSGHESVNMAPITPLSEYHRPGTLAARSNPSRFDSSRELRGTDRNTYSFSAFPSRPQSLPFAEPTAMATKRHAASFDPSLLVTSSQPRSSISASTVQRPSRAHPSHMQNRSVSDPSSILAEQSKRRRVSPSAAPSLSSLRGPGNNLTPRRSREPSHGLNLFAGQMELEADAERAMEVDNEGPMTGYIKPVRHRRSVGTSPTAAAYATPFSAGPALTHGSGSGSGSSGRSGTIKRPGKPSDDQAMNWNGDDSDDDMPEVVTDDDKEEVEEEENEEHMTSESDSEVDREVMMQEEEVFTGVKDEDVDDTGVWGWDAEDDDDDDAEEEAPQNANAFASSSASTHENEDDEEDGDGLTPGRYHFRPRGRSSIANSRTGATSRNDSNDEISDVYVEDESSDEDDEL